MHETLHQWASQKENSTIQNQASFNCFSNNTQSPPMVQKSNTTWADSHFLDDKYNKYVQGLVGASLFYAHAVNNKLPMTLSAIKVIAH